MRRTHTHIALLAFLITVLTGCQKGPSISQTSLTLKTGESAKLTYGKNNNCSWHSEQPLIAEVSNTGFVQAIRIGETSIYANDEECKLTVTPSYHMYEEPYIGLGKTKEEIKKEMSDFNMTGDEEEFLSYKGKGEISNSIIYYFDKNGKCEYIKVRFSTSTAAKIISFLNERYVYIKETFPGYMKMKSIDGTLSITLYMQSMFTSVTYEQADTQTFSDTQAPYSRH